MARRIPYVADGILHAQEPPGTPQIAVNSAAWAAWLEDQTTHSFSFKGPAGTFTARKERRSGGGEEYWTAYRKRGGRLRKKYLGKAEKLTLERLNDAAEALASSDDGATASSVQDASAVGDAGRVRTDAAAMSGPTAADNQARGSPPRGARGYPLLLTKLSVPTVRASLVPRPRLSERIEEGTGRKLTFVSAPAGFGKTTLLSVWISEMSSGRSVAWLSLDAADNDPARFWRFFIAAVDQLQPGSGETALTLLGSPQAPPIEAVLTTLLNELADVDTDVVLVLDDYHLIDSRAIHEALTFLIEHSPSRMHLVVSTRADPPLPLSRLRARSEMAELRAADLRFTPEEAASFFNQAMGLELRAEDIAELESRTEGWIAGLQMAALAMRDRADVRGFIEAFTGSNRYVLDYLVEEVLDRQSEGVRSFLLQTSVLGRMCGPLCDTVTGRSDGQATLERLERANLFVVPLDDERSWYRYHHLFADVLRQRLRQAHPDLLPELHRRASAWFERHELAQEAIEHALTAADWQRATRLLVQFVPSVVFRGQFHTALAWLNALPDAIVRANPTLCVYHAGVLMYTNELEATEVRLRDAERGVQEGVPSDEARVIRGQVAAIRGALAHILGDLARCVTLAHEALDLLPDPEVGPLKLRAPVRADVLTTAFRVSGDVTAASERSVASVVASLKASGNRFASLIGITNLARLHVMQGKLRQAAATYEEAMQMVSESGKMQELVGSPAYYFGMGDLYREWNDLDVAENYLQQGMELVRGNLTVYADTVLMGYLSIARLQQVLGESTSALATLEEFAHLAQQRGFAASLLARAAAARARVRLSQGDLTPAVRWAESSGLRADDEPNYLREDEYLTLARVLIAQGRDASSNRPLDNALGLLDRLLRAAEGSDRVDSVIQIRALQALALRAQDEPVGAAHGTLERALALAELEGYVRLFVDEGKAMEVLLSKLLQVRHKEDYGIQRPPSLGYVRRLLEAFESAPAATGPLSPGGDVSETDQALPDLLTAREWEVLQLIGAGLSNQEISARLFIATSTVKWHVHSILRKLDVDSRTRAVARAHELRLISE